MSYSKSEIKKRHKAKPIKVSKASVLESETLSSDKYQESFKVKLTKDTSGWYSKLEMIASEEGSWTSNLINKSVITIENYDGNLVINLSYNNYKEKIEMPLYVLGDLMDAAIILNALTDKRTFGKNKYRIKKGG